MPELCERDMRGIAVVAGWLLMVRVVVLMMIIGVAAIAMVAWLALSYWVVVIESLVAQRINN